MGIYLQLINTTDLAEKASKQINDKKYLLLKTTQSLPSTKKLLPIVGGDFFGNFPIPFSVLSLFHPFPEYHPLM